MLLPVKDEITHEISLVAVMCNFSVVIICVMASIRVGVMVIICHSCPAKILKFEIGTYFGLNWIESVKELNYN